MRKIEIQPLDIVRLDSGATGIVDSGDSNSFAVTWFGGEENKAAWWKLGEKGIRVIDSLPCILAHIAIGGTGRENPFEARIKKFLAIRK